MNIVDLAKSVELSYKEALKNAKGYNYVQGFGSKAYCKRRIEMLQDELLEMKNNLGR